MNSQCYSNFVDGKMVLTPAFAKIIRDQYARMGWECTPSLSRAFDSALDSAEALDDDLDNRDSVHEKMNRIYAACLRTGNQPAYPAQLDDDFAAAAQRASQGAAVVHAGYSPSDAGSAAERLAAFKRARAWDALHLTDNEVQDLIDLEDFYSQALRSN